METTTKSLKIEFDTQQFLPVIYIHINSGRKIALYGAYKSLLEPVFSFHTGTDQPIGIVIQENQRLTMRYTPVYFTKTLKILTLAYLLVALSLVIAFLVV